MPALAGIHSTPLMFCPACAGGTLRPTIRALPASPIPVLPIAPPPLATNPLSLAAPHQQGQRLTIGNAVCAVTPIAMVTNKIPTIPDP